MPEQEKAAVSRAVLHGRNAGAKKNGGNVIGGEAPVIILRVM